MSDLDLAQECIEKAHSLIQSYKNYQSENNKPDFKTAIQLGLERGKAKQLRAILRPAVEAARERGELNLNSVSKLIGTERSNKMALSYIDIAEKADKALLAAGEILGLTEQSAEESEAG